MAVWLEQETRDGRLAVADPQFAAEQFFALCQTRVGVKCKLYIEPEAESGRRSACGGGIRANVPADLRRLIGGPTEIFRWDMKLSAVLDHVDAACRTRWSDGSHGCASRAFPRSRTTRRIASARRNGLSRHWLQSASPPKSARRPGIPAWSRTARRRPGAPTILFYGHYDVQPAEPLGLWTSEAFSPVMVDGPHGKRAVARGAVDDKGQVMMWLAAFAAWHAVAGGLPVGVTVLLRGRGGGRQPQSRTVHGRQHREAACRCRGDLRHQHVGYRHARHHHAAARGLLYVELCLKAASRDLHSGLFGGSALNPINALTRILGDLHDATGRIQLPGFYDGVREISAAQLAQWAGLGFDEAKFLSGIGLSVPVGERDTPRPRRSGAARPPTSTASGAAMTALARKR